MNGKRNGWRDLPVERVSLEDVEEFLAQVNGEGGRWTLRLPTEAEWEYAARGGKRGTGLAYSGGAELDELGWFETNSGGLTHGVGLKEGNELGLHDMSGNVWEWCSDTYRAYGAAPAKGKAPGKKGKSRQGDYQVDRGGGMDSRAQRCRVAGRGWVSPTSRVSNLGFRGMAEERTGGEE